MSITGGSFVQAGGGFRGLIQLAVSAFLSVAFFPMPSPKEYRPDQHFPQERLSRERRRPRRPFRQCRRGRRRSQRRSRHSSQRMVFPRVSSQPNAWGVLQSITYRLADSLPLAKLKSLEIDLASLAENQREAERRKRIEAWLDSGMGCCALAHPEVARYVQDSWLHFHGDRYLLHAWCVMPNHVHVLIQPREDLATIVQGWKSFTSRWILRQNESLSLRIPEPNRLWMREYWDRFMRDENHYRKTVAYIHQNPVRAGLCATPEEWPWSSAYLGSADVPVGIKSAGGDAGAPGKT